VLDPGFNAEKAMKNAMMGAGTTRKLTWFFHKNFSENLR
jgi:hypothetical protein